MESAAHAAQLSSEAQVAADWAADLHTHEMMTAHEGRPTLEVQDRTHGTGIVAVDKGPPGNTVI